MAPHMVFASVGSGSAGLSAFGAPGVLLRVKEELTVLIYEVSERGMVAEGRPIMSTSSLDEVTAIMRRPLADSLFGALEQPQQGCDCSCEAYDELKAIAKLPKAKQEAHPKAMVLSMCAPECGMRWGTQCRRN